MIQICLHSDYEVPGHLDQVYESQVVQTTLEGFVWSPRALNVHALIRSIAERKIGAKSSVWPGESTTRFSSDAEATCAASPTISFSAQRAC